MKKHILLIFTLLISSLASFSQSTLLVTETAHGGTISNGQVIYRTVAAGSIAVEQYDLNIKNISSTTKSYKMKMFYDVRNYVVGSPASSSDTANPYFCFGGSCEVPLTMISSKTETLTPNQDAVANAHPISVHYDEASVAGLSSIRYRFYEVSNPTVDFMEFTMKYNDPTASIKTNASLLSYVSDVFPNPSNTKASINVTSSYDVDNAFISITNALGSIVSIKHIELSLGKNTIDVDSQALSSGLYFATITVNNTKITKKFTINK
jgi:hypothetical protein